MRDPRQPVVTDDDEEVRTRETYVAWMQHGLQAARRLVAQPGPSTAGTWPRVAPEPHGLGFSATDADAAVWPDIGSVKSAAHNGWLVQAATPPVGETSRGGSLRGLPTAVKDIIDVAGLETRNGTPRALWRHPSESAACWSRLAAEGAVCVGKAATHEMAWGVTTPQIPHPQDPTRCAGGSSGGSAALVAAGVVPVALGTDTGGSVRIPAALCGVVGFRPTTGAVNMRGVTQLASKQDVVGPLARTVRMALPVLEALLGRPCTPAGIEPARLRVGVLARTGRLQPAVETAYREALAALAAQGVEVVPCDTDLLRVSGSVSLLTMLRSSARLYAASVRADPDGFGGETRALLTVGESLEADTEIIEAAHLAVTRRTASLFAEERLDAFVTPTTACRAPERGSDHVEVFDREEHVAAALTRFTAWAPVAGMPAASLPVAAPDGGLPTGVQVMAAPGQDHVCAHLALAIERSPSY